MSNTTVRVLVALVGIPLLIGAIVLGSWVFFGIFAAIALLALYELYDMAGKKHYSPNRIAGYVSGIALLLFVAPFEAMLLPPAFLFPLLPLWAVVLLGAELPRRKPHPLANVAITLLGVLYAVAPFVAVIGLRNGTFAPPALGLEGEGALTIVAVLTGIWLCDSAAFFVGKAIGKHKIFPRVSPHKSWEGSVAGLGAAAAGVGAFSVYFLPFLPLHHAIIIGAVIGIVGQIGDFAESLLKRDAGIKDSSALIPGHGGFLDRFDSLLFAAPAVYCYLYAVFTL